MYSNEVTIARKYVRVLNQAYTKSWNITQLEQLESLKQLLGPRNGVLSYLRLDCIAEKRKYELIMKAIKSLELIETFEPLVFLLQKNKHLALLYNITAILISYIKKQLKVSDIIIYTAHELQDSDKAKLEEWVKRERHALIVRSEVVIKPTLIAGFRIEGDGFMGDYSVYRKLHNLKHICMKEGHLS